MEQLFTISRPGCKEVKELSSKYNEPHLHDYKELLIGMKGEIGHFIDFKAGRLPAPYFSFVAQGNLHLVKPGIKDGRCDIWMLLFKSEFIQPEGKAFINPVCTIGLGKTELCLKNTCSGII